MSLLVCATVVAAIVIPVVVLIAWAMWLYFAATIAKHHGIAGLKAIQHVSDGFRPREWALLIPRQWLGSVFTQLCGIRGDAGVSAEPVGEPAGGSGDLP